MAWRRLTTADGDDRPSPERLATTLDAVLASLGGATVEGIVAVFERWGEIVGAEVAEHAKPVSIEDGRLLVEVDGPAWASHLRWSEAEVVERLGRVLGAGQVTSIAVQVARGRRRPV